jgi:hypothetical protein
MSLVKKAEVIISFGNFRLVRQERLFSPYQNIVIEEKTVVNALGEQEWKHYREVNDGDKSYDKKKEEESFEFQSVKYMVEEFRKKELAAK